MDSEKSVFISHAKEDAAIAKRLKGYFAIMNYRAWCFEHDMIEGRSWKPQLRANIEDCDIFLFVMSEYSDKSKFCQKELRHAALLKKPIVPVLVQAGHIVREPLNEHQWILFDCSPEFVARLSRALAMAKPLPWEEIPTTWKNWDGSSKTDMENATIERNKITLPQWYDFAQSASIEIRRVFQAQLESLQQSDLRIVTELISKENGEFSCFVNINTQAIAACRVHIGTPPVGVIFNLDTINTIQSELSDADNAISVLLQSIADGDQAAAEEARRLDQWRDVLFQYMDFAEKSQLSSARSNRIFFAKVVELKGQMMLELGRLNSQNGDSQKPQVFSPDAAAYAMWDEFIGN